MAETLLVEFEESPFSPWGASLATERTDGAATPEIFTTIGDLDTVASKLSRTGLQYRANEVLTTPDREEPLAMCEASSTGDNSARKEARIGNESTENARLVELAVFPGFNPDSHTPLPNGLDTLVVMRLVTSTQSRLSLQPSFRERWKKIFYSQPSQNVFLDTFWWFFLQKYQRNKPSQEQLFTRTADNYVRLLTSHQIGPNDRDAIFKLYPDCIAQSIYSAFIHAFPNSWNSFDDTFKTDLCSTVYLWQVGLKPLPNCWQKWNSEMLEPKGLQKLKMAAGKEQTASSLSKKGFDFGAFLDRECKEEEQEPSPQGKEEKRLPQQPLEIRISDVDRSPTNLQDQSIVISTDCTSSVNSISKVAYQQLRAIKKKKAQESSPTKPAKTGKQAQLQEPVKTLPPPANKPATSLQKKKQQDSTEPPGGSGRTVVGTATPSSTKQEQQPETKTGKTVDSETPAEQSQTQQSSDVIVKQAHSWKEYAKALQAKQVASGGTAICGPTFEHVMFDVHGQSPLVKHYMRRQQLSYEAGHELLVNRTEISTLPSSSAQTFQEVLERSAQDNKDAHKQFKKFYSQQKHSMANSHSRRKKANSKHETEVQKLLANKKEVHHLSNQLTGHVLDKTASNRKSKEAIATAINKAIETA